MNSAQKVISRPKNWVILRRRKHFSTEQDIADNVFSAYDVVTESSVTWRPCYVSGGPHRENTRRDMDGLDPKYVGE